MLSHSFPHLFPICLPYFPIVFPFKTGYQIPDGYQPGKLSSKVIGRGLQVRNGAVVVVVVPAGCYG
jgi:hypothetical protein